MISPWFIGYASFFLFFTIVLVVVNIRVNRANKKAGLLPKEEDYFINLNGESK